MHDANPDGVRAWIAYRQLCDLLAVAPRAPLAEETEWLWEEIVGLASEHLVSPALAAPVGKLADATEEVRSYFFEMLSLNARRNEIIGAAIVSLASEMARVQVPTVFLKGSASLALELYDDDAERMMGDIDILVAPNAMANAERALRKAGYDILEQPPRWVTVPSHQLPMMIHRETGVGVELHHSVARGEHGAMLPTSRVFARAEKRQWRGCVVNVPCATDRALHNIIHDQLHHHGAERGVENLRQLRELALMTLREGERIDWRDIETRFAAAGLSHVLNAQAVYCDKLMGAPLPIEQANPEAVMAQLRDHVVGATQHASRAGIAFSLLRQYAQGFRRQPSLALNLLNPSWWPTRLRGWKDALRRR